MHYKNGRKAKQGDQIVCLNPGNHVSGILHSINAESNSCNGRVARVGSMDPYVTLGECLHVDDVAAAGATIPDSTKVPAEKVEEKPAAK